MKKGLMRIISVCVCLTMIVGVCAASLAADGDGKPDEKKDNTSVSLSVDKSAASAGKEETVYVISGADGKAKTVISSCHLMNPDGAKSISDVSVLKDIENVKGDETFKADGENVEWEASGSDIYYRGNCDKALPVEIAITYFLDGKEMLPDEIAGKSGRVTIRFDYKNNEYRTVEIGGKEEKIYVPFAVVTGAVLDNDVFTNVEVKGGRALDDGDRTAVIGLALPGMQENLALAKEKLEIPDSVEVTADVKDFKLDMTLSVALNDLFGNINLDGENPLSNLEGQISKITDAMAQLTDGSSKLYEGLDTLYKKSGELKEGVGRLESGAASLEEGAAKLDGGASALKAGTEQLLPGAAALDGGVAEIKGGIDALNDGLSALASNSDALNGGALTVFNTLLATAKSQLAASGVNVPDLTVDNYAAVLDGVISSLDSDAVYNMAKAEVTAKVEENRELVAAQVTSAVRSSVRAGVINAATGKTAEEFDAAVAAGLIDQTTAGAIEGATDSRMNSDEVKAAVSAQTEQAILNLIDENMNSEAVQTKIASAAAGKAKIAELKTSLDSYNTFYKGLLDYTAGVGAASAGASKLAAGALELKAGTEKLSGGVAALDGGAGALLEGVTALSDGASALHGGVSALNGSVPALEDGVKQLRDGAKALSDGIKKFGDEAVGKIVSVVSGLDLEGISERVGAMRDAAKSYNSFSGIAEGVSGSVKFIYRTEGVYTEDK